MHTDIHPPIHPSIHLPTHLSIHPPFHPPTEPPNDPPTHHPSIHRCCASHAHGQGVVDVHQVTYIYPPIHRCCPSPSTTSTFIHFDSTTLHHNHNHNHPPRCPRAGRRRHASGRRGRWARPCAGRRGAGRPWRPGGGRTRGPFFCFCFFGFFWGGGGIEMVWWGRGQGSAVGG